MILLRDVKPEVFAVAFNQRVRDVAFELSTITGMVDSLRASIDPSNLTEIVLHVVRYAQGIDKCLGTTEAAIGMVTRLGYNALLDVESDPDFHSILKNVHLFEPQSELDAVTIGAYARWCIDHGQRVLVSHLAVLAGVSWSNCSMHLHRGNLKGGKGTVTAVSAKKWLTEREPNLVSVQSNVRLPVRLEFEKTGLNAASRRAVR